MTKHLNLVIADWFVSVSSGYTSSFCTSSLHAHQDLEWFTCENYIFHVFTRLNYIYKYIYILYFIGYIYITFVKTHPTYFEINTICHKTQKYSVLIVYIFGPLKLKPYIYFWKDLNLIILRNIKYFGFIQAFPLFWIKTTNILIKLYSVINMFWWING